MRTEDLTTTARAAITAKKVFAEPYERDGLTVIAAATVAGGAGGGSGHDKSGQEGEGGGFGLYAKPSGAYVIRDGKVDWRPAVDVNRLLASVAAVVVAYLFTRMRVERARLRFDRHGS